MKAWTIRTITGRALIYATTRQQAAALYTKSHPGAKIKGISPNYHAQNMKPRPESWSEYVARGGGQ